MDATSSTIGDIQAQPAALKEGAVEERIWGYIDKSSPVPYHYQLRRLVERAVTGGELPPGARIPTEAWFCERYGVSRTVVRQALNHLELEGLVVRIRAKGTFIPAVKVSERISESLTSLHEDLASRGETLETRVLKLTVEPASPHVAEMLEIDEADDLVVLERLGIVRNEPLVFATTQLPYSLASPMLELDMNDRSFMEVLEQLGRPLHHTRRSLEARLPSPPVAQHLSIDSATPVLVSWGVSWLQDGRPIEYSVDIHRADRSRFDIESYRRQSGQVGDTGFAFAVDSAGSHDKANAVPDADADSS